MIAKGTWVSVRKTLLAPQERTGKLPPETKTVPFVAWIKGRLQQDAEIGDEVCVTTRTGLTQCGTLEAANPQYELNYGKFVGELLQIGEDARAMLAGDHK